MKSLTKGLSALVLLLVALVGLVAPAYAWTAAPDLTVEVNGMEVTPGVSIIDVERGETLDLAMELLSVADLKDVEVTAKLSYEYGDETTTDSTGLFDLSAGKTKKETLSLALPADLDLGDALLKIIVEDKDDLDYSESFNVHVSGKRHELSLERVLLSPSGVVKAGSELMVKSRIENLGERNEEDIVFAAEIEGLEGTSDLTIVDELAMDESITLDGSPADDEQALFLTVPTCAKAGDYKVKATLTYNKDKSEVVKYFPIKVVESESALCKPQVSAMPKVTLPEVAQNVKAGQTLVLPVTITNSGSEAKNYVVSATVGDMGALRFVPANTATIAAGATETLYVYVDTAAEASGEKVLGLSVNSGSELVKEATIKVNVAANKQKFDLNALGLRRVLEIGLVVLIVLIVLVGLIIGFNKLKDDEDEDEEDEKSYY
jgi:hypothetical protein